MELPSVTVVIPARNEEKTIGNCLKSILEADYPKEKLEILVAIDGCKDRTEEIARSFKNVNVVAGEPKTSKAAALNSAWPKARGEIVAIFDSDCIVTKDCIREAVKHFSNPDIVAVSGPSLSYNESGSLMSKALSLETTFISYYEYFLNKHGADIITAGNNMFFRKSILENVKGFDEEVIVEDLAISIAVKRKSPEKQCSVQEPKAVVYHEEPPNFSSFIRQRRRWTRGAIQAHNKYEKSASFKEFLSDAMHGTYFYFPPFTFIITALTALFLYLSVPLLYLSPLYALFIFVSALFIQSLRFFRQSLTNIVYFPIWFFLSNLQALLIPLSILEEMTGKQSIWYRPDRAGLSTPLPTI